ncbi:MAG: prepilin-type N-terminal cleavage/methylation domain-containing protein [Candidatus Omnitrophica bacterium]|nr:prepilin-type N-terminal cleavage/methylation domain-containing protein [Candidatus Omnitrophota bacterium]
MKKDVFTLIELLIVIIIITILAGGIILPQYPNLILKSHKAKAKHAISLIAEAEKIYMSEYGSYLNNINQLSQDTGIDLSGVINDTDWTYVVSGSSVVATKKNNPKKDAKITYNLSSGEFSESGF